MFGSPPDDGGSCALIPAPADNTIKVTRMAASRLTCIVLSSACGRLTMRRPTGISRPAQRGSQHISRRVTGDRPQMNGAFKSQLVDWYLHQVYEELDGPLTDAISKIPVS